MCGQQGFFGTSAFQILLDVNKTQYLSSQILKEKQEIEFDIPNPNDKCSISNIKVNYNIDKNKQEPMDADFNNDLDDYIDEMEF
jgi:hypothetical protein